MHKKIFLFFLLSLFFGCAVKQEVVKPTEMPAQEEKFIEVEAEAEIVPTQENLLITKRDGLEAAKRKAVEKAVGVYVTGQMMVSKAVLLHDKIFSKTAGYIKDYKVVSEGMAGEFYKTKIWAKVKMGDIKNDIDALELMIKTTAGNPRVVVIIDEEVDGVLSGTSNAETNIIGQLLNSNYRVVDQEQLEKIKEEDTLKAAVLGDEKAASIIGKKFEAEIAVIGKIKSTVKEVEPAGVKFIQCNSDLNVKVIKVSTGDLLFSFAKNCRQNDITKEMAVSTANTKLAEIAGKEFVSSIAEKLTESNIIKITISGISSINILEDFKKFLRSYESVTEVTVRSFVEDTAEIELDVVYGTAPDFASRLGKAKKWDIKIIEVGGHSIIAEIKK
ncbi:MAG: hypothetical protein ABH873_08425 [Candidatus Firestonebacteria bacterium]